MKIRVVEKRRARELREAVRESISTLIRTTRRTHINNVEADIQRYREALQAALLSSTHAIEISANDKGHLAVTLSQLIEDFNRIGGQYLQRGANYGFERALRDLRARGWIKTFRTPVVAPKDLVAQVDKDNYDYLRKSLLPDLYAKFNGMDEAAVSAAVNAMQSRVAQYSHYVWVAAEQAYKLGVQSFFAFYGKEKLREGGPGSGDPNHPGRPGQVGGSAPSATPIDRATPVTAHPRTIGGQMYLPHMPRRQKPPPTPPKPGEIPEEQLLKTAEIESTKHLGGGVNETLKVRFAGGQAAVFKPESGIHTGIYENIEDGKDVERETAAWETAKLVGTDDLVAPTVERVIDGERGSLMLWENGTLAAKAGNEYDGNLDSTRAAVFDYVIGNQDRHRGNWILQGQGEDQIKLIDHNLTFPEGPYEIGNQRFIDHVIYDHVSTPSEMVKPYVDALPQIRSLLSQKGLNDSISGLETRIRKLQNANEWNVLEGYGAW